MAGLQQSLNDQESDNAVLSVFESIIVEQTKSFLLFVGKEFPDLNKLAEKIKDIPSIRKNISLIALIMYTLIYNKRPQGLELSDQGKVDEVANLTILIESVAAGVSTNIDEVSIDAEAILTGTSRANTALNIHSFVKLLEQLHRETLPDEEVDNDDVINQVEGEEFYTTAPGADLHQQDYMMKTKTIRKQTKEFVSNNQLDQKKGGRGRGRVSATASTVNSRRMSRTDAADELEAKALSELNTEKKIQAARIRKMKGTHKKKQQARSTNLLRNERIGEHKRYMMASELERLELSKRVQAEMSNKRAVDSLLKQVLREMSKEVREENMMNAEHLKVLEQQRISQIAASSSLFMDRASMIRQKTAEAKEAHTNMIREQEQYLNTVFRESEMRHNAAIEAKVDQLNLLEDAALLRAKESRHAIADLFNSTRLQYLANDRVTTPNSPFDKTLREIRSNAHQLRQQQIKMKKQKQLRRAYASKPFATTRVK